MVIEIVYDQKSHHMDIKVLPMDPAENKTSSSIGPLEVEGIFIQIYIILAYFSSRV